MKIKKEIETENRIIYYLKTKDSNDNTLIIKQEITNICIYIKDTVYYLKMNNEFLPVLKEIFENSNIEKIGYKQKGDYILLKQIGINITNLKFDVEIAGYILNSINAKYSIEDLSLKYLDFDIDEYLTITGKKTEENNQLTLFEAIEENDNKELYCTYAYCIDKLYYTTIEKLKETNQYELFEKIEMPTLEVLADMQWNGMYINKQELIEFGKEILNKMNIITQEIYEISGEEFNINSPKQLGVILFEKLNLPVIKKNKNGYSTDVDVLEKLKSEHPIVEKILEFRQLAKLNSTFVEGLLPYINEKTNRIHSYFHQTVTATGRISSTEPNLQNIPTKLDLGKQLRKVFKAEKGIFIDADYSQIELRVLAHISKDETMIDAFNNDEDIHAQVASKVFNIPMDTVTKEQRTQAKAVNFGIVYGISDYGLGEQLGIGRKLARQYIDQYFDKYKGIHNFMEEMPKIAKEKGYVETLFNRRRYIPEIESKNFIIRQFGVRAAMNTPIQGTAADIMKMAMIEVYKKIKENNLKSKIVLQVHDELIIEATEDEKDIVKKLLKDTMENVVKFDIPLKVEVEEGKNWYDAK